MPAAKETDCEDAFPSFGTASRNMPEPIILRIALRPAASSCFASGTFRATLHSRGEDHIPPANRLATCSIQLLSKWNLTLGTYLFQVVSRPLCGPPPPFDNTIARLPLGHTEMAFLSAFSWFVLVDFMTIVEPYKIVRPRILEMRVKDQRSPSSAFLSVIIVRTTSTASETNGAMNSVGMA